MKFKIYFAFKICKIQEKSSVQKVQNESSFKKKLCDND